MYILWIYIVCLFLLDQYTKHLSLSLPKDGIPLLARDFLMLFFSKNTGIAFSIPFHGIFQQILTVILIGGIVYFLVLSLRKNEFIPSFLFASLLSGSLGNAYERIVQGYVIDFLSIKYFAIVNLADIVISMSVVSLIIFYSYYDRRNS